MHPKEFKKVSIGTGRLTHLFLKNSKIIIGEKFDDNNLVNNYIENYNCHLLYPGENATNLSSHSLTTTKKNLIFILDGTWPCAKSMLRDSPNLHHLPRVSFSSQQPSLFSIKHQPDQYCLSTIESTKIIIDKLIERGHECAKLKTEGMTNILEKIVKFQIDCANNPELSRYRPGKFKSTQQKKQSKKWQKRSILFKQST